LETILSNIVRFFQASHPVLYAFTFMIATFLLLSGLDDLLVDLYYWFNYIFRHKHLNPPRMLPEEQLYDTVEKPIAIFVPAWEEEAVIEQMLTHACKTIGYRMYDIFVGVYPNDPRTKEKVLAVASRYPQVHVVVASHRGPSTKAQNLNDIHRAMLRRENQTGVRYDIIVLHDAEDVIHPLSLKCFNCFIPQYDMVQLPVYPLVTPARNIVHWTYSDEFAENHTKDMMARQLYGGFTPSAGVGTGYNRWLIEFAGTSFARNLFRKSSLTEDYDFALRLALGEAKLLFLYKPFGLNIATWAYFPKSFRAAVRQRTRWLLGICIQSWKIYGWIGDLRFRFALYRDRKAVITNLVNALAYVVLAYVILYELVNWGLAAYGTLRPIVVKGTLLWYIVLVDTALMLWRFLLRFISVRRVYDAKAGLYSIPRLPVSNIVNFVATLRALKQYFLVIRKKHDIAWEKTSHTYPSPEESQSR
jgi:adsorption protein B